MTMDKRILKNVMGNDGTDNTEHITEILKGDPNEDFPKIFRKRR